MMKYFKHTEKYVPATKMSQMLTKGGVCSRYYFISEIRRNRHRQLSLPSCPEAPTIPKISVNPPPVCLCVFAANIIGMYA